MNQRDFHRRWSDRAVRYPGAQLFPEDRAVHIHIDSDYADTYAGQVAAITAASLFGRMSRSVAFDAPLLRVLNPLPWEGKALADVIMETLQDTHPFGQYEERPARSEDLRLVIGSTGQGLVVHGSGWRAYRGTGRSPLRDSDEINPYGAAFAAIIAAARFQRYPYTAEVEPVTVDMYDWQTGVIPSPEAPQVTPNFELGQIWDVGVGSVGSCALYFLSLVTNAFHAVLIDSDRVEVENVTRSALFSWMDAWEETPKVEVASRWLQSAGVKHVETHQAWLDQIMQRWRGRDMGTPDLLISAANERNVRYQIESAFPPLQVYATTGRTWQATLFRHIPMIDACSCCQPSVKAPSLPALCATGSPQPTDGTDEGDDVALPFLSYAAGAMTAAEITKLALAGHTGASNRVFFEPEGRGLFSVPLKGKSKCFCQRRDGATHWEVIRGSRFARLSVPSH